MLSPLTIERFGEYFQALHERPPYPWQQELARRALAGAWPRVIDLPTGSGKTACIDVAVFALACQAARPPNQQSAPRRIFFCVNRRVIVDEAYQRARRIAAAILEAECESPSGLSILRAVAAALRRIAGTSAGAMSPPLDVLELRGGIFRDNRWARSLTQPTIICTTVDQLGSRLLFRGYGVSPNSAPIQAALTAYDSLIVLDEAHISRPFLETLEYVRRYLGPEWAEHEIGIKPALVVPMTATPPAGVSDDDVLRVSDHDRGVTALQRRLSANKPAQLSAVSDVVRASTDAARDETRAGPVAVGIIVNRVETARQIWRALIEAQERVGRRSSRIDPDAQIELIIGSMRPLDRDAQAERLREIIGPDRPPVSKRTSFVVATQCLEVGADYDFDVLITECAALDALRQRFGRLNRAGRAIRARAHILIANKDVKPERKLNEDKPADFVYGNALARTWNWLCAHAAPADNEDHGATTIDLGVDAFQGLLGEPGEDGRVPGELLSPSAHKNAPVMLPAYLDLWCQTAPVPEPDPDVALFIHGPQRVAPDVQVCWRADLVEVDSSSRAEFCNIVALLPPTAAECMTVPLYRVRRWLIGSQQDGGDLLGEPEPEHPQDDGRRAEVPHAVIWRGVERSTLLESPDELRPGDTLVLPVSAGGWEELGHIPGATPTSTSLIDIGDTAFANARNRAALRLHPALKAQLPSSEIDKVLVRATDADNPPTKEEWRDLLAALAASIEIPPLRRRIEGLFDLSAGPRVETYPRRRGVVLTGRRRIGTDELWSPPALDDGEDQPSRSLREAGILLSTHTRHVMERLDEVVNRLPIDVTPQRLAAALHDTGKADERFQALLRRSDRTDAWLRVGVNPPHLAKSSGLPLSPQERNEARQRAGLPVGFRHEMLSVQLAERCPGLAQVADHYQELALHLIAAHHGHARPFAPVVMDTEPPDVEVGAAVTPNDAGLAGNGVSLVMTSDQRRQRPPHRLDSGIAERFWRLTRRYGWWGLAYLEAVLRLTDQQASAAEELMACDEPERTERAK